MLPWGTSLSEESFLDIKTDLKIKAGSIYKREKKELKKIVLSDKQSIQL